VGWRRDPGRSFEARFRRNLFAIVMNALNVSTTTLPYFLTTTKYEISLFHSMKERGEKKKTFPSRKNHHSFSTSFFFVLVIGSISLASRAIKVFLLSNCEGEKKLIDSPKEKRTIGVLGFDAEG
jgi:hypothetical protein